MKSRINKILDDIDIKKEELLKEYEQLKRKYDFSFKEGKIMFTQKAKEYNKKFKD